MAAPKFPLEVVIKAVDNASTALARVQNKIEGMTAPVRRLSLSLSTLWTAGGGDKLAKSVGNVHKAAGVTASRMASVAQYGALAAGALGLVVWQAAQAGDRFDELSVKTGVQVETLQRLAYAASFSGVESEALATNIAKMNKNTAEAAAGNKTMATWFQRAGISAKELRTLKPEETLGRIADAIAALPEDSPKRAALAMGLLGRSGADLLPMLAEGGNRMRALASEADRLGLVMGKDATKQSAQFTDEVARVWAALRGLAYTISSALVPVLIPVLQQFQEWIVANRGLVKSGAEEFAKSLAENLPKLVVAVTQIASAVAELIVFANDVAQAFGGWQVVAVALAAYIAGPLVAALISLSATLLATPIGWLVLGLAGIGAALVALWKNWDAIWDAIGGTVYYAVQRILGFIPDWLIKLLGGGGSSVNVTGTAAGSPAATRSPGQTAAAVAGAGAAGKGHVVVDFRNMPQGVRVAPDKTSDMAMDVLMGRAMPLAGVP